MSLFDLVFICVFLASVSLLAAAVFSRSRVRILRGLGAGLGVYFGVVVAASLILPQTVIAPGSDRCYDDWCVAVERVQSTRASDHVRYDVTLQLSSRAKRITQREGNLRVYVTGSAGERIEAVADKAAVPFNVPLGPGDSAVAARTFMVPASVRNPSLVITHGGGFPIGWLIIGYDTWFRKPDAMPLTPAQS